MAAAAVVSAASFVAPNVVVSSMDLAAVARKRRRNVLTTTSVGVVADVAAAAAAAAAVPLKVAKMEPTPTPTLSAAPLLPVVLPAQPIVTVRKSEGAKRPQMKYDPSVPMTKEETSAWRREQRRKRNRESAAACRKRQRDRISELEVEVSDWKAKFDDALLKLKGLDGDGAMELEVLFKTQSMFAFAPQPNKTTKRCRTPPPAPEVATSMSNMMAASSHIVVSPHDPSPKNFIPSMIVSSSSTSMDADERDLQDLHFPVLEEDPIIVKAHNNSGVIIPSSNINGTSRVENRQHLNEKITRPAKSRLLTFSRSRARWMDHLGYYLLLTTQ
ncbi:hypothetical protein ACHAXR_005598 [Thalassiosira sp. AJA248-18]